MFYPEKILWLASLAEMTKIYNIQGLEHIESKQSKLDNGPLSISIEYFINQFINKVASVLKK